jgi:phosphatidylglycerophosphate synthase
MTGKIQFEPDRRPQQSRRRSVVRQRPFWREALSSTPNRITTLRLALIPGLWLLAILQMPVALGVMLGLAASTDVVDGYLARRHGLVTEFGSRFDSFVDHLLIASAITWVLLLRPEFFAAHRTPLLSWLVLGGAALLVGLLRFGRLGDIHPYSAKLAGVLGYGFAVYLLIAGSYPVLLFQFVIAVCLLAAAETLLIQLVRASADERVGSIVQRWGGDGARHPCRGSSEHALADREAGSEQS